MLLRWDRCDLEKSGELDAGLLMDHYKVNCLRKKTNRSTWLRVPGRARNRPLRFILKYFHIQNDLDWNWEKYLYSNMAFLAFNQNSTSKIVFEILTRSFMSSLESQNVNVSSAIILRLPIIKVSSDLIGKRQKERSNAT